MKIKFAKVYKVNNYQLYFNKTWHLKNTNIQLLIDELQNKL